MRIARLGLALALGATLTVGSAPAFAQGTITRDDRTYRMTRFGLDDAAQTRINRAVSAYGARTDVGEMIRNATQRTRPLASNPTADTVGGFRWEESNENETDWYPQGITGSADSQPDGIIHGFRELIVSWHSNNPDDAYSRITVVQADDLDNGAYRHALLVAPDANGEVSPVRSHAGGIVWYKTRLYVADTNQLLVFDMRDLIKVRPGRRDDVRTYNYILPLRGRYDAVQNPGLRFSSVSLDRSGAGHALVTSEFLEGTGGRIVRWPLNEDTGLLGETVTASGAWTANGVKNMQGVLMKDGRFGFSLSYRNGADAYHDWKSGAVGSPLSSVRGWPVGAQDLHYAPTSGRIYSLTEFANQRSVFAVRASTRGW
jgi:hypothetical protein